MNQNLIFIVDDDLIQHTMIDFIISKYIKNPTLHFYNGRDCIKNLELKPKIIFLDYEMEDTNGLTTFLKIKEINQNIVVIFISSLENQSLHKYLIGLGAFNFIQKDKNMHHNITRVLKKLNKMNPDIIQLITNQ